MKAKNFEQQFDEGVDITSSLDLSKTRRVLQKQKRVNVDHLDDRFPGPRSQQNGCGKAVCDQNMACRAS